jgi:hypothetical protein
MDACTAFVDNGILSEVVKSDIMVDVIINEVANGRITCDGVIFGAWLWWKEWLEQRGGDYGTRTEGRPIPKGRCGRFWCGAMVGDGVGDRSWRDRWCQGLGWTDTGDGGDGGDGCDRFGGMVDCITEVEMWWKRATLDATIDIILDPCVNLTKCKIHALVVADLGIYEGVVMSSE